MKTREIVIYGILSAVLLAAQVSLGFLCCGQAFL